uniref:Peptidase_M13 domain-containing protein n=2 Tax=Strongyloides stercoralis TaxID=6248 RepID=A0A0K0EK86_STRER
MKYFIIFFYFLTYFVKVNGCRSNKYDVEEELNEYIDRNVDPCEEFYQFTCGKWIKNTKAHESYNPDMSYVAHEFKFDDFVLDIMSEKIKIKSRAIEKMITMAKKCRILPEKNDKETCFNLVRDFGNYAFATLFINERLHDKEVKYGLKVSALIFDKLKEEFRLLIDEKKDIFDETSRINLLKKISKLKFGIKRFLKETSDKVEMEKCYSYLDIFLHGDAYKMFKNLKELKSANLSLVKDDIKDKNKDKKNCLSVITQHGRFFEGLTSFNAFYATEENIMTVTTEVLTEPVYHKNYPLSFLFGGVGYIIGHEILHAFESGGIRYDENGKNGTIITLESEKKFNNKTDCFEKQYSNAKEPNTNLKVKGNLTLNENLADNGGIKIAHRAYMKYLESIGGSEPEIPGFESFTSEQLFFINFGRAWCSVLSKSAIEKQIEDDVHSPGSIRIDVTLSNYKPFSKAFNCKVGSKMNPSDKCELWLN